MSTAHTEKKPISLLTHFRRYLVIVVGLLLILLLVRFLSENLLLSTWQSDATNALMLQQEVGTLQQSMLNQETGLRGYISTDDPLFLQPFTQGRQLYRMSLQHLKDHLSSLHFQDVQAALVHEDTRATIWYTTFALVQLQQVHRGQVTIPRSVGEGARGKRLFDQFRLASGQTQTTVTHALSVVQAQERILSQGVFFALMLLTLFIIVFLFFSFKRFARDLRTQLTTLQQTTQRLEGGDLHTRVGVLKHHELRGLGQTLNHMAATLQQQQQQLMTRALLIERANEYWALLNTVNTGLLFLSPERQILVTNDAFCTLFACHTSEIVGHLFEDLAARWVPLFADAAAVSATFALMDVGTMPMDKTILLQLTPARRELEFQILPVSALQEHLLGSLVIVRDITQERELERTQSEFISTVCHEFRTSLTGIQGFSELICDEGATKQEATDFAQEINADALRLTRLITDLLDLERMQSGRRTMQKEPGDLNRLLEDEAERAQRLSTQHSFVLDLARQLPTVPFDEDKIHQVLQNLLSNAVKYSPQGGEIVIQSRIEGTQVHVNVQDQGIGIPAEALSSIFDPYSRIYASKTRYIEGTGLGLTIVRAIIEVHGGQTWAESPVGEGANVHFTLPLNPVSMATIEHVMA
jgi:signal transduction histidine kinase